MIKIRKPEHSLSKYLLTKTTDLDYNLLKVLVGEKKGTKAEITTINRLQKNLKDDFYGEALFILSHKSFENARKAKDIYFHIIDHRNYLSSILGRNIGIEVATLDYMHNIHALLREPEIIERDKISELVHEALVDEKTGALGCKAFMVSLNQEIERTKRFKHPFSLLFIDINRFKQINDEYGHMVGDWVLRKTVQTIRDTVRAMDTVCRWGGDELVCLLPEIDLRSAKETCKRVAENISKIIVKNTRTSKTDIKVTASIGVVQSDPYNATSAECLIAAADQAMYQAKNIGKNCVSAIR